jgi:hypothetical protein
MRLRLSLLCETLLGTYIHLFYLTVRRTMNFFLKFFSCVPFTTYEDYQPFVARLLDTEFPRLSDVNHLLSPGLPSYIIHSSGTSGNRFKHFPKYPVSSDVGLKWDSPDVPGFKLCRFNLLNLNRWTQVVDDDGHVIQDIPVCMHQVEP